MASPKPNMGLRRCCEVINRKLHTFNGSGSLSTTVSFEPLRICGNALNGLSSANVRPTKRIFCRGTGILNVLEISFFNSSTLMLSSTWKTVQSFVQQYFNRFHCQVVFRYLPRADTLRPSTLLSTTASYMETNFARLSCRIDFFSLQIYFI